MNVYGYCRVSTDRQADKGESLIAQRRNLEGYAMMHDLKIDQIFVERGVSGSKPLNTRPEGAKLLALINPGDAIITSKLDRMFRSAPDALNNLADLKKRNISLHMLDLGGDVTGDGISKLVFQILSAVAENESDRIRERIRDVKSDQKSRGRYLGGSVPFGWKLRKDGQLVEAPPEQAAIRRMVRMRNKGESLRTIARVLEEEGFELSHVGVKKVIQSALKRKIAA